MTPSASRSSSKNILSTSLSLTVYPNFEKAYLRSIAVSLFLFLISK